MSDIAATTLHKIFHRLQITTEQPLNYYRFTTEYHKLPAPLLSPCNQSVTISTSTSAR